MQGVRNISFSENSAYAQNGWSAMFNVRGTKKKQKKEIILRFIFITAVGYMHKVLNKSTRLTYFSPMLNFL